MAAREPFGKMAAALDSNRKIQKAGRDGRDVYLWVLRQIALRDSAGCIPAEDVRDAKYVAKQLMCSASEAGAGLERAIDARLLEIVGDGCYVVGWDEEWGRRPLSNAERQQRHRDKDTQSRRDSSTDTENVTKAPLLVTGNVTRNAGEERRGEEKQGSVTSAGAEVGLFGPVEPSEPAPDREMVAALALSVAFCDALNDALGTGYKPDTAATLDLCRKLVKRKPSPSPDDVHRVVEAKVAEWHPSETMRKRLVPKTLLAAANFFAYLVELDEGQPDGRATDSGPRVFVDLE